LAHHYPIEDLLIPLSAYLQDRKISPDIHAPYCSGRRAFSANHPFPKSYDGSSRLPRVLREATTFVLMGENIKTEGIFRISAPAKVREILKEAYDRGQKFIIWKDNNEILPLPQYPQVDDTKELLEELDQSETYGVHLAASIIKLWYSELKDPLVPQSSYRDLIRFFDSGEPALELLIDLISPHSDWSCLPSISREILTRHLLPMLAEVVKHKDESKMNAENLAVCFAPTFVCGTDQMEDIKISNILRRILATAVDAWPKLHEIFAIEEETFWNALKPPSKIDDYEDPLYERSATPEESLAPGPADIETQRSGIIMKDNEVYDSDQSDGVLDSSPSTPPPTLPPALPPRSVPLDTMPPPILPARTRATAPPLPPRPPTSDPSTVAKSASADDVMSPSSAVRRKPAPLLTVPPRYSVVVGGDASNEISDSPSSYTAPVDGFGPSRRSDWSIHSTDTAENSPVNPSSGTLGGAAFRRKPVGSGDEGKGDKMKE
jgi:Rho GTPase-activating protein 1